MATAVAVQVVVYPQPGIRSNVQHDAASWRHLLNVTYGSDLRSLTEWRPIAEAAAELQPHGETRHSNRFESGASLPYG